MLERSLILSEGDLITERTLPLELVSPEAEPRIDSPFLPHLAIERQHIQAVLRYVNGNRNQAASILGISRKTFYRRLKQRGL